MRVAIFHSEKQRCNDLAAAIYTGVRRNGDECIHRNVHARELRTHGVDVGIVQSVRRRELFDALPAYFYIDKGYIRDWDWRRVAMNNCEPIYAGSLGMPSDRRLAMGWCPQPWRKRGGHILMCWSNEDEHTWRGLLPPEDLAELVVRILRQHTDREIRYRCKPGRIPTRTVAGATMGDPRRSLVEELIGAHAVVLVGGGVSIAALLKGVPVIVLGDGPTMGISSRDLEEIEQPRLASDGERESVLNDLAYSQWRVDEFASGEAWHFLRQRISVRE